MKPVCIDCGKEVSRKRHTRCKSCSNKYMVGKHNHSYKERITVICDQCGKEIKKTESNVSPRNFCDQKCMGLWKSENLNGDKASSWKGGITTVVKAIRQITKVRQWREGVLKRDEYICQECGATDHLEAHHIISFSELVKLYNIKSVKQAKETPELWDINNGQTLCVHCHAEKHPDMRHLFNLRIA